MGPRTPGSQNLLQNRSFAAVVASAEVGVARGQSTEALARLDSYRPVSRQLEQYDLFRAAVTRADAWRALGDLPRAIEVLASWRRDNYFSNYVNGQDWLAATAHLATLYRDAGRVQEALPLEEDLRGLLRHADPDHEIVRELALRPPPFGSDHP